MSKSICFFGSYSRDYARNIVLEDGLKFHKVKIFHCGASGFFLIRYWVLTKQFISQKENFETILVGFPGHLDLPLAYILGKIFKKRIIFDIFASKYETYVLDRGYYLKYDPRAIFYYLLDFFDIRLADLVLTDTETHLNFYRHLYEAEERKFLTVYVGAEEKIYYPQKLQKKIDVFFYGSYQPLQGAKYIVEAARDLKNVSFLMVGSGQTRPKVDDFAEENDLKNIQFKNWVSGKELARLMNQSRIVLGIFGDGQKALSVIPNKLYGGLACGRPVITGNTPAVRELLVNNQNIVLVNIADSKALSNAISSLLKNKKHASKIAADGYKLFRSKLSSKLLVQNLIKIL